MSDLCMSVPEVQIITDNMIIAVESEEEHDMILKKVMEWEKTAT